MVVEEKGSGESDGGREGERGEWWWKRGREGRLIVGERERGE